MKTFLIAGAQRSGTTLLSVMLGKHSEIHIDGKSVAYRLVSCFQYYENVLPYNLNHSSGDIQSWLIENDYKGRLTELLDYQNLQDYGSAREIIQQGIAERLKANGKTVFGDKTPNMEQFLAKYLLLVPEAKFIHIVRDGRAVAASQAKRAHRNMYLAAQEWVDSNIAGLYNQAMIGEERYKLIRYEDLLQDPETVAKTICAFLDIPFEPAMIAQQAGENEATNYVKSTFDASKIEAFKSELSQHQIKKLERIQGPLLEKMGYQTEFPVDADAYKPLSEFQRIWYHQRENTRQLFIGKRMGMVNRQNVEVAIPLKTRVKTFAFELGRDLLPERVYRKVFRKRWIKKLRLPK